MGLVPMAAATITAATRSSGLRLHPPVDIYVPGYPPTAEALMYAFLLLLSRIRKSATIKR